MITEAIMNAFFGLIGLIMNIIPTVDFSVGDKITWLLDTIGIFMNTASYWLPMGDLLFVLSAILVLGNIKFIVFIVNWVIRRIADLLP